MNKNKYSVYCHINKVNYKMYFGITNIKPKYRWNNGNGYKTQKIFYNAIKKYGWDNFDHLIIEQNLSEDAACNLEKVLIEKYNTTDRKNGYNFSTGGIHYSHTEETKKHLSKVLKGKHNSPKTEFKKGWIPINKGKKMSLEQVEKLRERAIGNKYALGHKLSEEQKKKISEIKKGKRTSLNTEFKKGEVPWNKGIPMTPEHYEKCKATMFQKGQKAWNNGKKMTEEQKQKLRNAKRKTLKKVLCLETGVIYDKIIDVEKILGIARATITAVCKGRPHFKTAGGYHWKYIEPKYE